MTYRFNEHGNRLIAGFKSEDVAFQTNDPEHPLIKGIPAGKSFTISGGKFELFDVPAPQPDGILKQITEIEGLVTPRRLREAVLTEEGATWLSSKDTEIAALRGLLK